MSLKDNLSTFLKEKEIRESYGYIKGQIHSYFEKEYKIRFKPPDLRIEDMGLQVTETYFGVHVSDGRIQGSCGK